MLVLHARGSRTATRSAVLGLLLIFALSGEPARRWSYDVATFAGYAAGASSRLTLARFAIPSFGYDPVESRDVGEWLRARTRPGELVLVRGFVPEIHAVAGRAAPGRFFWSVPLTDRLREYRLDESRAEDRASIDRAIPTFVVVFTNVQQGPESAAYFVTSGYVPDARVGRMTILRRGAPASARLD